MKNKFILSSCLCLLFSCISSIADADSFYIADSPLVQHPISLPISKRSSYRWRSDVGAWGENFAENILKLRGFKEVYEIKNGKNNGIDRIAIKRGLNGKIIDVRFVEVKTSQSLTPKLSMTKYGGKQMSRKWLASNLKALLNSGNSNLRKLALEISLFRKSQNIQIDAMGELIHINPKNLKMAGYAPTSGSSLYDESLDKLLLKLSKSESSDVRKWSKKSLNSLSMIQSTNMSDWLDKSQLRKKAILKSASNQSINKTRRVLRKASGGVRVTKLLRRATGRIALVVALAMDTHEVYEKFNSYNSGNISVRDWNKFIIIKIGGVGGAFAGAWVGGELGAWAGGFGGPFAEFTVPAGLIIGGGLGAVIGYWFGESMMSYGANAYYDSLDAEIRNLVEIEWLKETIPEGK